MAIPSREGQKIDAIVRSHLLNHSGLTSLQAHSTNPRQARNNPSTTPSSKCRSGSAATRQRSAACSSSSTVSAPTIARSLLARLTRRPGDTSVSGQGCPSAPSHPRMRLRMPSREFRSGRGVSSLMGSTTVYEEKVSDSFMASASVAVLNSATAKRVADDAWLQTGRSDVINRWARKPPRTARQKGRRIARRHRLRTVPTGKRKLQTSLSSGLQTRATRFRWRAMVLTPPLRMPIEIREGIAESESEELLLHAPFVQHATPADASRSCAADSETKWRNRPCHTQLARWPSLQQFLVRLAKQRRVISHTLRKAVQTRHRQCVSRLQPTRSSAALAFPTSNSIIARAAADWRRCGA